MMANKRTLFVTLEAVPLDLKHSETSFSPNLTDLLCLRAAKVPRCRELAILFVDNDDNDNDRTDYCTPCACARGSQYAVARGPATG